MHNAVQRHGYGQRELIENHFSPVTIPFSDNCVHFYNHTRYVVSHLGRHRINRA